MSQIHITDGQTDQILDVISAKNIIDNKHHKSLKDTLETFDFTTFADKTFSGHLIGQNRVIIPDEDGKHIEFVIHESGKFHGQEGLVCEVYTSASYLMLKKAKVISPNTLNGTAEQHVISAVVGTEWQAGNIEYAGVDEIVLGEYSNPFKHLKRIASIFGLELSFRVEVDGNKVIGRYVDLLERVGQWQGREAEFDKDLIGIRRNEKTDNIVTALVGLGPEREDGTRLEVIVEDGEALARWGRGGRHIIEKYEPESADQDMTEERLITLTTTELNKRVNAIVEYETTIADLEHVPGMENKRIRFGDTIKIKDTKFNPALYLEARVHTQNRDIVDQSSKVVELGDYIEYTEDEVRAIWLTLQAQIREKISQYDLVEYTYPKDEIDGKDERVYQDGTIYSDAVSSTAEDNAKEYADEQLQHKVDSEIVDSINDTIDSLQGTTDSLLQRVIDNEDELSNHDGRITTVTSDLDTVEGNLNLTINQLTAVDNTVQDQQIEIDANATAISFKASQDDLDIVSGDVSSLSAEIGVQAGRIDLKAEQSSLESLEGDVTSVSNNLSSLTVDVGGISTNVSSLRAEVDGLEYENRNLFIESETEDAWIPASGIAEPSDNYRLSGFISVNGSSHITFNKYTDDNNHRVARYDENYELIGNRMQPSSSVFIYEVEANVKYVRTSPHNSLTYKVSRGNKATDWTPAPEDTDQAIINVYSYAESEITQLADEINLRVEKDGVIGSINLTSESATIDVDKLNITGDVEIINGELKVTHLSAATGTFSGTVETARLVINNPDIEQEGGVGLQLQTAQWQASQTQPYVETGHIEFNTLNDALEIYKINLSGNEVPLDGFRVNANTMDFLGDIYAHGYMYTNAIDHFGAGFNMYIRPGASGEVRVTETGTTSTYLDLRADNLHSQRHVYSAFNFYGGNNSVFQSDSGYTVLRAGGGIVYLQTDNEARVTAVGGASTYRPIRASSFPTGTSLRENKKDIEVFDDDVLSVIRNSHAYLYLVKGDDESKQKQLGLMVDETPRVLHGEYGDSMEMYALNTYVWRGVQQLTEISDNHEDEINYLKIENQYLNARINEMEARIS